MTFGELQAALAAMTPEQLAMRVHVCGEDRGGRVSALEILAEDQVNPSGDGMEPISLYRPGGANYEEGMNIDEEELVVARKGQGLLLLEDDPGAARRARETLQRLHDLQRDLLNEKRNGDEMRALAEQLQAERDAAWAAVRVSQLEKAVLSLAGLRPLRGDEEVFSTILERVSMAEKFSRTAAENPAPPTFLIYIAGPYSAPTAVQRAANVQRAREVAAQVAALGAFPVTPHLLGTGIEDAGDDAFWYRGTLELMRRCDAVVVLSGVDDSKGTRAEIDEAKRLGVPVFDVTWPTWEAQLKAWMTCCAPPRRRVGNA